MGFSDRIVCTVKGKDGEDVTFELREVTSKKQLRTIKCDAPDCTHSVEIDIADTKMIQTIDWLPDVRMVTRGDEVKYVYCSDACEVRGVTRELHNIPKKVELPSPPAIIEATEGDVKRAAAQAAAEAQTTEALKTGGEAQIYTTD
jgi:hypothetical protein